MKDKNGLPPQPLPQEQRSEFREVERTLFSRTMSFVTKKSRRAAFLPLKKKKRKIALALLLPVKTLLINVLLSSPPPMEAAFVFVLAVDCRCVSEMNRSYQHAFLHFAWRSRFNIFALHR